MFMFLDFDGVLHPISARPEARWTAVGLLAALIEEVSEIAVVVSSTYRAFMPFDQILQLFPLAMRGRIVGGTPVIAVGSGDTSLPKRHREILVWLEGNGYADSRWLAVDDDAEYFADDCRELFLVDGAEGLTSTSVEQLRQRLRGYPLARHSTDSEAAPT